MDRHPFLLCPCFMSTVPGTGSAFIINVIKIKMLLEINEEHLSVR